jgi:hypothetical protein
VEPSPVEEPATEQPSVVMPAQRREPDAPSGHVPSSVPTETVETSPAVESAQTVPLVPLVPSTPPAAVTRRAQAGNRFPLWLAISFGALSLLCVAGLGIGFHYYDKATKPNRSAPDVALANYMQTYLVDRDDSSAAQYSCGSRSSLAQIQMFRDGVERKEKQIDATIGIAWQEHDVTTQGPTSAAIDVTLTESANVDGVNQILPSEWTFELTRSDGWRVCGATQVN